MIYVEMYGRLGNQFFRYAAARTLQLTCFPDEQLVFNFEQIDEAHKTDQSFYNVLADFNVTDYSVYEKGGKVLFQESSIRQKLVCIPYYLGMRKLTTEQMKEQEAYEKKWRKRLVSSGIYWFRRGGGIFGSLARPKTSLFPGALKIRPALPVSETCCLRN